MFAAVGDRVFVESVRPGHEHMGRIVALRHSDGTPPYVVRWDDTGTETLHFPRADSRIEPAPPAHEASAGSTSRRVHHWTVTIDVVEHDQYTTAHAVLHEDDAPTVVTGRGESVRRSGDRNIPELGDELAVSRAMSQLADRLALAVRNTLIDVEHREVDLVDLTRASGITVREQDLT